MRIISIRQPWASLIVAGGKNILTGAFERKDVENRTWATAYRGLVLIHSSQRPDDITTAEIERRFGVRLTGEQPRGGVIGMVEIVDCVRPHPSKWYTPNHWAFVLANSRPLPFVKWKGALSLRGASQELFHLCGLAANLTVSSSEQAAGATRG
ncbi:ASCH domain-containing protein [Bradyrhizobium sp. cf659]|uniref:ASCH domain-containing protein n=1 Tax=Bradyrhizobium sp. cf659 TaxID=1761771 RepID=UPI0008E07786|nr:ASCH domain-containing protein [Bradyrhizobium sp. cf659]SFH69787.1 ASCH domain-containing protein [Bradyrhizobium sp. cf659]